jgi:hypothetical protein
MAIEKFIPTSPDLDIREDSDLAPAKFGHLNALVDDVNNELANVGSLKLKNNALLSTSLVEVVDKNNAASVLRISSIDISNFGGGAINTNTAFGKSALIANTTGSENVAFGLQSLLSNTIGASNVGIGFSALLANTEGVSNIGVGTNALNANATGDYNTVVGTQSAIGITTGSNNVVFGTFAIPTLNGSNNTILGYNTGQGITTGSNNTILGANVAGLSSTLNNNIIIADGSGNRRINVDSNGNVGVNQNTPTARLNVVASGTTTATTSLLVQNSAFNNIFRITDDGTIRTINNEVVINKYDAFGLRLSMSISNGGHNGSVGLQVTSGENGIVANNSLGFNSSNRQGASILANGGGANSLGLLSRRALISMGDAYGNMSNSAMLQVDSTTQGFLPPRMTTAEKNAIATPAAGLMVYDTDLNKLCVYTTAWETITSA